MTSKKSKPVKPTSKSKKAHARLDAQKIVTNKANQLGYNKELETLEYNINADTDNCVHEILKLLSPNFLPIAKFSVDWNKLREIVKKNIVDAIQTSAELLLVDNLCAEDLLSDTKPEFTVLDRTVMRERTIAFIQVSKILKDKYSNNKDVS